MRRLKPPPKPPRLPKKRNEVLAGKKILLGVTGSIAAYKSLQIVRDLTATGAEVQVVLTPTAHRFVPTLTLKIFSGRKVFSSLFDPQENIAHLGLVQEIDLVLIAPITANFIAKMTNGFADDLLSTLLLAATSPVMIAPAMDLGMWEHPSVRENISRLRRRGVELVGPAIGALASGKVGIGRFADESEIVERVKDVLLREPPSLAGECVMVTAGPTQESIDPVRYISNRSSGRMGYALAEEAKSRGARVVLISGPTALSTPAGVERVSVKTAAEMSRAFDATLPESSIVLMAAAVSDYRPIQTASQKIKKTGRLQTIQLEETEDILGSRQNRHPGRIVVGFAAETENLLENAKEKRTRKGLDLIVANDVTVKGAGFDSETNAALLIDAEGAVTPLPLMSKRQMARKILNKVVEMKSVFQANLP
ncbi:MAG: bifunctional phosphopantothenoylcysteine decarboxylase/phosphopantothenate--cysteine ligase CoaBC [Nitrospiria bacterium]